VGQIAGKRARRKTFSSIERIDPQRNGKSSMEVRFGSGNNYRLPE
jgi:hypothetical protein